MYICIASIFIDATNTVPTRMHMGVEEVEYLAKEYPNTKIYAIHRSDYIHNHIKTIEFPEDEIYCYFYFFIFISFFII